MTVKVDDAGILADALREVEEHDAQVVVERDGQFCGHHTYYTYRARTVR
jgi:sulfur carrier protein ThiS